MNTIEVLIDLSKKSIIIFRMYTIESVKSTWRENNTEFELKEFQVTFK